MKSLRNSLFLGAFVLSLVACKESPKVGEVVATVNTDQNAPQNTEKPIEPKGMPEIIGKDPNGKILNIKDIKAPLILIDFWASWCKPCRGVNPAWVKLYAQYHERGLEVFQISLDENPEKWKKAIAQDHLTWPYHISDLKGWNSEYAQKFNVTSIPATFLVDSSGVLLAADLEPEQLDAIIGEKLKKKP